MMREMLIGVGIAVLLLVPLLAAFTAADSALLALPAASDLARAAAEVLPVALVVLLVAYWRFVRPLRRVLICDDPPAVAAGPAGGVAGLVRDMRGQLARTEAELAQHRHWCEMLFDDALEATLLLDPDSGAVVSANAAAQRLLVRPADGLVGMRLTDLLDQSEPTEAFFARVRRDGTGWATGLIATTGAGGTVGVQLKGGVVERAGQRLVLAMLTPASDIGEAQARLATLAYHDPVTGLPNRVLLRDRLDTALRRAGRDGSRGAILMLDVDDFKNVNDGLNHSAGDRLLQELATRLLRALADDETVGRLGGDEFLVHIQQRDVPAALLLEQALSTVEQIRSALDRPFVLDGMEIPLRVSFGIAVYPDDGTNVDTLLKRADAAMYQAKSAGGDSAHFYAPAMELSAARRLAMTADLRRALTLEQFLVHYQPKVDMADGRVIGCEALVRWQHPERGLLPPGQFLPYLENSSLFSELGFWVLDQACQRWSEGRRLRVLPPDFRMAVNVSAGQFAGSAFVDMVLSILQENGMPACNLELEITEQALVDDLAHAAAKITALQAAGVTFAIDDFGTGYSSLAYLQQLPVDSLKIDRGFVSLIGDEHRNAGLVDVVITLARKLGLQVTAEGVECEAQRDYLVDMGCDLAQGYLFGRPVSWQRLLDTQAMASG